MPTRITRFLHSSTITPGSAPVLGTGFSAADVHVHDMTLYLPDFQRQGANYRGIVEGIHIELASASSPTTVTIRVCSDAAGNTSLVPDTTATLVAGIGAAATKCAAFSVKLPIFQTDGGPGNGNLYLFAHVDNATGNPEFKSSTITWME